MTFTSIARALMASLAMFSIQFSILILTVTYFYRFIVFLKTIKLNSSQFYTLSHSFKYYEDRFVNFRERYDCLLNYLKWLLSVNLTAKIKFQMLLLEWLNVNHLY